MEQRIGERQRWAWLAACVSAVAAVILCGLNWLWVLTGGLAVSLYYLYIEKRLKTDSLARQMVRRSGMVGKVLSVFMIFWIVLIMGYCACLADSAFPMVDGFPALGWVLLAMAAWGSSKGARACAGCSGVLCLFLLALYGIVAAFSLADVRPSYLMPSTQWQQAITAAGMFLLPVGVWMVPVRERKGSDRVALLLLPILSAALAAITAGVLTPEMAAAVPVPLYELARSVSVLGVVERIEPLLSAAMTMGIFCLLTSLTCACQALADQVGFWKWSGSLCALAAAGIMYVARSVSSVVLVGGNLLFFLVFPAVSVSLRKK